MSRTRILVVDDEPGATRLLKANLELTNEYEVLVENQPENALRAAREFRPHLALLDIVMPNLSGYEVARAILSDPSLSSVRVVLLTAADKSLVRQSPDPAVTHLPRIKKPASMEVILKFLKTSLQPPARTFVRIADSPNPTRGTTYE